MHKGLEAGDGDQNWNAKGSTPVITGVTATRRQMQTRVCDIIHYI